MKSTIASGAYPRSLETQKFPSTSLLRTTFLIPRESSRISRIRSSRMTLCSMMAPCLAPNLVRLQYICTRRASNTQDFVSSPQLSCFLPDTIRYLHSPNSVTTILFITLNMVSLFANLSEATTSVRFECYQRDYQPATDRGRTDNILPSRKTRVSSTWQHLSRSRLTLCPPAEPTANSTYPTAPSQCSSTP